ncbi:30S ribosomal protein S15 [Candidatus Bathyarchaeota archaeon]|nr:30S ribosomal protein S15 [Candidatus Bathyarchaeota archaeon]
MTRTGKAHSTRPISKRPPTWCKYTPEEVEALVVKLAKEENPPSKIGIILRDQYGIPLVKPITGKRVSKILSEAGLSQPFPEDLDNLVKRATSLRRHLGRNKGDLINKRALALVESKVRRLAKYYVKKRILPRDWKYKPEIVIS